MVEWHVTPDYIVNNWTDELLLLMQEKLIERKTGESERAKKAARGVKEVPESVLFAKGKNLIKVVKK